MPTNPLIRPPADKQPEPEKVYAAEITMTVYVIAKNKEHAQKIIEGGVSLAINVVPRTTKIEVKD
ncbi:hypothetical protein SE17_19190 [Kouleothrix aurantiaca]|uniref:Uncharacterized protein n=1 Tax=Kouleothrix aurantiaca TaxID=186479 RepID=A0A0P9HBK2_9CHLR|nr:hypothetical protein SE17_19190 [Kouleothrix aurantiaca]